VKRPRSIRRSLAARVSRLVGRSHPVTLYQGSLVETIRGLNAELDRGAITPEEFVRALDERCRALDLEEELAGLLDEPAGKLQPIGFHQLLINDVRGTPGHLWLFFVPAGVMYPPHAHHDMLSVQRVVRGRVHLRQYERVTRLDPETLGIRPAADRMLEPGGAILMTEFLDNVHWFGAEEGPAVVLNFNRGKAGPRTFDPRESAGKPRRYFVDPTGAPRPDGLIAAPHLAGNEARARFARRPIRDFPLPA
jgi:hypothetical protein